MATETFAPGTTIAAGRYRLERIIGTGGMAIVWRATDLRLGRPVAVKVIADTLAADPAYVHRFTREAKTAAGLSHANLVQVYDYAADVPQPYLVSEYVDGGTLADRIARGPADAAETRAIAGDVLAAVDCVHQAGILHRDIKPANVLVGSDGRARLTDFGIAHPEDATRLTQTGHLIGTIRYLAPELVDGADASRQSDLYAVGVLLRDLMVRTDDPGLDDLVRRLTQPAPSGRPRSAGQALRALHARRGRAVAPGVGVTAPTRRTASGHAGATRRDIHLRLTPARAAGLAAVAAVAIAVILALSVGDGGSGAPPAQRPAGNLTLDQRFDQLDGLIQRAG